jgi:hypothetical protein
MVCVVDPKESEIFLKVLYVLFCFFISLDVLHGSLGINILQIRT